MHFDAGKLNRRISFHVLAEKENEIGQLIQAEKLHRTIWANVRKLQAYEKTMAEKLNPESIYRITTRYFDDITEDMTIIYNDKRLYITSIVDVEEGHFCLEITATDKSDKI